MMTLCASESLICYRSLSNLSFVFISMSRYYFSVSLHEFVQGEYSQPSTTERDDPRLMDLYLREHPGCELNERDQQGWTILSHLARYNYAKIMSYLIKRGAEVDIGEPATLCAATNAKWDAMEVACVRKCDIF